MDEPLTHSEEFRDAARILRETALINPLVAEPLATVFDTAATCAEVIGADVRLLEVARAIRAAR